MENGFRDGTYRTGQTILATRRRRLIVCRLSDACFRRVPARGNRFGCAARGETSCFARGRREIPLNRADHAPRLHTGGRKYALLLLCDVSRYTTSLTRDGRSDFHFIVSQLVDVRAT